MQRTKTKAEQRTRRHARIRAKVFGTSERPRLAVYRSNRSIYAQLINDEKGVTVASARSDDAAKAEERARMVGETIAKAALAKNITKAVFDRGGFLFTGNVKAVAEGARAAGLVL